MTVQSQDPSGEPKAAPVEPKKEDVVKYETYQKVLSEKKGVQAKLEEMQSKFDAFELDQKTAEETKLNEKGEFKKLVELREQEIVKLREEMSGVTSERDGLKGNLDDTYKLQAFYDKLPGQIKKQEYLNFVDLESIVIDPVTRAVDPQSLENVVGSFVENYGDLIKSSSFGGLPGEAPVNSTRKYTIQEWKSLSLKDKKEKWTQRPSL